MPIYDFRCPLCGRVSEIFVHSSNQAVSCPYCGDSSMERLISLSYMIRTDAEPKGTTCCGRNERCQKPPCSTGDECRRR